MATNVGFTMGAVGTRFPNGNWEVFCNRCDVSIGVMDSDTLTKAVFNTASRGGVLCPDCRAHTCDFCGLQDNWSNNVPFVVVPTLEQPARACLSCREYMSKAEISWEFEAPF